ncbi:uncharacterized protein TRUGW13939_07781 [Talaromyces rugulosus]|uniref:Zn(2)-C6 fungal-type domain-containing protein n=1 Tax=Talaromyces rugulosus TaxID=121627 RepID=A0A7H8R4W3_TALRU|nr:uncharacterized protein TRUGW13939_07781 [Talaromyces rugulosus]QKX60635.1 hypothetical protein TRUGW13939_07781 [Talaromyces rugulosus]
MSTERSSSVRRRLACDRCHSFKLKCPRPAANSNGICARCLKAGTACVYSPSMRGQVRAKAPSGHEILRDTVEAGFDEAVPVLAEGISPYLFFFFFGMIIDLTGVDDLFNNMAMDWSAHNSTSLNHTSLNEGFDWISQLPPQTESWHTPAMNGEAMPQFDSNTDSTNNTDSSNKYQSEITNSYSPEDERVHIVPNEPTQRPKPSAQYLGYPVPEAMQSPSLFLDLINLSVHLENLSRQLPAFSLHETAGDDSPLGIETPPSSKPSASSPATESDTDPETGNVFAVMHKLVDLYQGVLTHLAQRRVMRDDSVVVDSEGGRISAHDSSLVYLLFSSHHRLIDLWHCMFTHSKTVLRTDKLPMGAERHKAHCAKMRLGSYVPSSSSTVVPMEIIVIQELAMHLTKRVGDLLQAINSAEASSTTSPAKADKQQTSGNATVAMISAATDLQQRMVGLQTGIQQLRVGLEDAIAKQSSITKNW